MTDKQCAKRLTLKDRYEIVTTPSHESQADLARKYGVSKSAINQIMKNKKQIINDYETNPTCKRKSSKGPDAFADVEQPLFDWFLNMRSQNQEISGALIVATAKKICTRLGAGDSTKLDISWVQRWRGRHNIKSIKLHGEAGDCPDYNKWLQNTNREIAEYAPEDIYNMDETALFYRATSGRTFIAENETSVKGRKSHKARVTLLVGCSLAGQKLPLIIVGTSVKPHWPTFNGKRSKDPLKYLSSRKGWMTTSLFSGILSDFEKTLKFRGRKGLLFLDNCTAHKGFTEVYDGQSTNLRVMMLPPQTTARLQPCDQGVIRSLKSHYRSQLGKFLVAANKESKCVTLFESLCMIRVVWDRDVSADVIKNAWQKSGLGPYAGEIDAEIPDDVDSIIDKEQKEDIDAMIEIENAEPVAEPAETSVDTIADEALRIKQEEQEMQNKSEDSEGSNQYDDANPPTTTECIQMLKKIQSRFLASTGEPCDHLMVVQQELLKLPTTQAKITDYFSRV